MTSKPRVIFTLLWDKGNYVLSRNFRLQAVGDAKWLKENYNFNIVSRYIDEIVVLNVSRGQDYNELFADELRQLTTEIFTPVAAGGWVRNLEDVTRLLRFGADRVVVNSCLFESDQTIIQEITKYFGSQCVLGSLDVRQQGDQYVVYKYQSQTSVASIQEVLQSLNPEFIGELLITSIDRDGSGMGFDLELAGQIAQFTNLPFIISGGAGNSRHFKSYYSRYKNGAAATAHLFNFIGSGLKKVRESLVESGVNLARWDYDSSLYLPCSPASINLHGAK